MIAISRSSATVARGTSPSPPHFDDRISGATTLTERLVDVGGLCVGGCADLNAVYRRPRRPTLGPLRQMLKCCFIADSDCLNAAVATVSHPPSQPQSARLFAHRIAKPHALHLTGDSEMQRRQLDDPARLQRLQLICVDARIFPQHARRVLAEQRRWQLVARRGG